MVKQKIRLAFVAENALGGIISVITGLMSLLDREKFEFRIALIDLEWRRVSPARQVFERMGITPYLVNINSRDNKYHTLMRFQKEFLAQQDLIIASDKYELIAYCLGKLQMPLILMVHNDSEYDSRNCLEFREVIDRFVPISDKVRDNLLKTLGEKEGWKIRKLNHALPAPELPYSDPFSARFVIAFVGRFNEFKGVRQLTGIGNYLHERSIDADFLLITNGVNEDEFRKEWKYNDSSRYYSNIPNLEVQRLLAGANVLLMPSTGGEGFPVALVEAMRRGIVPICSNLATGFPELVTNGVSGFLIDLQRIDKFGETVIALAGDRQTLQQMSKSAIRASGEKFDPIRNAAAYEQLFAETLDARIKKKHPRTAHHLGQLDKPYLPDILFRFLKRRRGIPL